METLFPICNIYIYIYIPDWITNVLYCPWRCLELWSNIVLGANNVEHKNYVINQFQDFIIQNWSSICYLVFLSKNLSLIETLSFQRLAQKTLQHGGLLLSWIKTCCFFLAGLMGASNFNLGFSYLITREENSHRFLPLNILLTVF